MLASPNASSASSVKYRASSADSRESMTTRRRGSLARCGYMSSYTPGRRHAGMSAALAYARASATQCDVYYTQSAPGALLSGASHTSGAANTASAAATTRTMRGDARPLSDAPMQRSMSACCFSAASAAARSLSSVIGISLVTMSVALPMSLSLCTQSPYLYMSLS